jgi:hypothetical protein
MRANLRASRVGQKLGQIDTVDFDAEVRMDRASLHYRFACWLLDFIA